jgi:nucleotide-binding universal stress UspA family protein
MRHYHNLLYVSHGTADETEGLRQALSLARNNKAKLKVLIVAPAFPSDFPDYQKKYRDSLIEQSQASIEATEKSLNLQPSDVALSVELLTGAHPADLVIQQVMQNDHDMVIKEAQPVDGRSGFKAIDMDLLRKCPVPVWLCRSIPHSRGQIKVAVAIDPQNKEGDLEALSLRLLQLSRNLADSCDQKLQIVSCWDYELEATMKQNVFLKIPEEEVDRKVEETKAYHLAALNDLIAKSGIDGEQQLHHLRGTPSVQITQFAADHSIDVLVMGTLARTGIAGFMIGNTAENIVQNLPCSVLALKPQSFVSPVKG